MAGARDGEREFARLRGANRQCRDDRGNSQKLAHVFFPRSPFGLA
jgi:hypothetical protein